MEFMHQQRNERLTDRPHFSYPVIRIGRDQQCIRTLCIRTLCRVEFQVLVQITGILLTQL